jgi:hypothetical protein
MYRIAWQSLTTNTKGHGEFCLTHAQAEAHLSDLSNRYGAQSEVPMHHWIEEAGAYRITSPYSKATRITPSHLQETDFERRGTLADFGTECQTQNARLLVPITIELSDSEQTIVYPKDAYIRLYHRQGAVPTVHLISQNPLP